MPGVCPLCRKCLLLGLTGSLTTVSLKSPSLKNVFQRGPKNITILDKSKTKETTMNMHCS